MALTGGYAGDPVYLKGKYTGSDTILVAKQQKRPLSASIAMGCRPQKG